jgi:hypothetical protein
VLTWTPRSDGVVEVRYQGRYYAAPREDVIVLPINNTSSENLAGWLAGELRARLAARFADVEIRRLRVGVEETTGQSGVYTFEDDSRA